MRAVLTFGLLILASVFVQGLMAQATPVAALPGGGSDFSATSAILYEISMNPGDSFTNGVVEFTDADTGDMFTLSNTADPALSGISFSNNGPATNPAALTLTFTGTLGAVSPGANDYTFDCTDDEGVPNTVSITVRITVNDLAPTHAIAGGSSSGDGLSSGTAYTTANQSKGTTPTLALSAVTEPNGDNLNFVSATVSSAPSAALAAAFSLTGSTSSESLQVSGVALVDADVGTHSYTIVVEDPANNLTSIFVSIVVVNAAPVLGAPNVTGDIVVAGGGPPHTATVVDGEDLAIDFTGTDADGSDTLSITVTDGGGTNTAAAAGFVGVGGAAVTGTSSVNFPLTGTAAVSSGTVILNVSITDDSGTPAVDSYTVTITFSSVPTPSVTLSNPTSLSAFSTTGISIASGEQTYDVDGADLTANVAVTPPTGFEISFTTGAGFTTGALTIVQTAGTFTTTTIFVRYVPGTAGPHSGDITHVSAGSNDPTMAVTGSITGGAGQVTIGDAPSHPGGAQSASPGNSRSTLAFRLTENAGSSFDLTGATVNIAMTNNGGGVAAAAITSVRISRGGTLATITNGGTGWSATATDITLTFTFSASTVNASSNGDFVVTINFAGGAAPKPSPAYVGSISNGNLTGSGSVTNTATVTGGQITLKNTVPNDPFADDDDDGSSCDLTTSDAPSWLAMLLLMFALVSIGAIKRRKA